MAGVTQPELLEQLRDIHLPADPTWWPPAPGWWLLAAVVTAGLVVAALHLARRWHRRRAIRMARKLYRNVLAGYRCGEIPAHSFLHQSNELLKRLLIHGLNIADARPAVNERWLRLLDAQYGAPAFTRGPGRLLGLERFKPTPAGDFDSLADLLQRFFHKVKA